MDIKNFIQIITIGTLAMSVVQLYLRANKIWKRKHEREVAESQSIFGLSLLMLNCVIWLAYYLFVESDTISVVDTSIIMLEASIFLLISTGFFVRGKEKASLWKLFKQALKVESKEADYLLKKFFRPTNAENIINMLHQLAMIDNDLDPKEKAIIASFAKEWNIDYSVEKFNTFHTQSSTHNYIWLRKNLQEYLQSDPPQEQVAQLRDMMNAIVHADDKITKEEELISSELMGIISGYLDKNKAERELHHVLIVPQRPEHEDLIKEIIPDAEKINISGGIAYSVGAYYSSLYADMICKQYRQSKMFTIVHSPEDEDELNILKPKINPS